MPSEDLLTPFNNPVIPGSRITANLMYEMRHRGVQYGIGSACIGGGQGIALLLEKC